MYRRWGKRLFDVIVGMSVLLVLSPLILVVAILVRVRLGAPVLFRQERAGRSGVPFTILKFRTMTNERDAEGVLLPDEERLTTLGAWLRRTSLDEIPELVNVVRGEMSLVGPRPLFVRYIPLYTPDQARRHEVRPGVTGRAQVSGRNSLAWDQKFTHDVEYLDAISLVTDLSILFRTVMQVARRDGISEIGHPTSREFRG